MKAPADLGGEAGLAQIAMAAGIAAPKVHRYIASLGDQGLVLQRTASSDSRLGPAAVAIRVIALRLNDGVRLAIEELNALRCRLDTSCFVAVLGAHGGER